KTEFCTSFNFGPELEDVATVDKMCELAKNNWDKINAKFVEDTQKKHEAGLLKLDITKAKEVLNWKPMLDSLKATALTINWYKNYYQNQKISSGENLKDFMALS
ncbi:MAG: CDP-glucose 4,6-dehydratase, partial [Bdellovibrio sp. CG_4_9_14_3_um_filter_39_7]